MGCGYRAAMAADGTFDGRERAPLFRSGWEIGAMVGGFVIFFPVGLAILGYLVWRKKMGDRGFEPAEMRGEFKRWKHDMKAQWRGQRRSFGGGSGNMAFDDYRTEVMRRLEQERRKLDDEQRAFNDFVLKLKRAKDQEEFDRFMADRNGGSAVPAA
jgi:Protein of unknown function (DUF2852)